MAYIGNQPVPQATQTRDRFVATASQTSFATSGYTPGFLDVYLNGVKLDSTDYTATNGSDVVLASGATSGDIVEVVAFSAFEIARLYDSSTSSTGYFALPTGTTAQRPGSPAAGYTRYNTTTGSLEFYDGTNWISTNLIPVINSISGTIYVGLSSTLTLSLTSATDTIDVKYYEGGTLLATDSGVTVTSGSATSTVPSAVYGQTVGDTISVSVSNSDGTPSSNSINKTVAALPTGGTITTSGGYRYHTFTSSGTFTNTSGVTSVEWLGIAGGGSGGSDGGGGGGAGGLVYESSQSVTATAYSIVIGAGGATGNYGSVPGQNNGNNSTAFGSTIIGGGRGGGASDAVANMVGASGGSGGGGARSSSGGSGTSGQGYAGGNASSGNGWFAAGGGGAGGAAPNASASYGANVGGAGKNSYSTWATATSTGDSGYYAGGGGGGYDGGGSSVNAGGAGGGGDGGWASATPQAGQANTGGGGGGNYSGGSYPGTSRGGGPGGSGIVIIRYQL